MPKVGGRRVTIFLFRKKQEVRKKVMTTTKKINPKLLFLRKENVQRN